jgi:hypothetical protein
MAISFLVAIPGDALATGSGLPPHEVNMTPFEFCDARECAIHQSLPTNVYAWNRTNGTDNELIETTFRLWVYTNLGWQKYDQQGWAYSGAQDNRGSGGLWVYPYSGSTSQTVTSMMAPVYVWTGYYYRTEVFIRWTSSGVVHSHRSALYRAGY